MTAPAARGDGGRLFGDAELSGEDESYVRELTQWSFSRLEGEPRRLAAEDARLGAEAEELAVRNYRCFVESATSVADARASLSRMTGSLDSLLGQLPSFASGCSAFASTAQRLRAAQRLNQAMLDSEGALLELLEIPQLMENCARLELYEAALDLEEYARTLRDRHAGVPVVEGVVADMRATLDRVHDQLLATLGSTVKLPVCLAVIGHLRRMGRTDEHGLRAQFLRSRSAWVDAQLARLLPLRASSPYGYVTKYLDCSRTSLFEVVTQYRSIFVDDTAADADDEDARRGRGLLYYWAARRSRTLIATMRDALPALPDSSFVAGALEQCMYCGQSLARVGIDFRGLLPPLFEERAVEIFLSHVRPAPAAFAADLGVYDWLVPPDRLERMGLAGSSPLLPFPPLAMLASRLVAAFNQLRQCAPLSVRGRVSAAVAAALAECAHALRRAAVASLADAGGDGDGDERRPIAGLARAMAELLLPRAEEMLAAVYPGASMDLAGVRRTLAGVYGGYDDGDDASGGLSDKE